MRKRRILVVDDNEDVLYAVGMVFDPQSYEVVKADSGATCLKLLEKDPVDVILMDIMMPHMDGWELCHWVRERYDLPIIIVSADARAMSKRMAERVYHSLYYVEKPFDSGDLLAKVESALQGEHDED